jgi:hypothetical protein
VRRELSKINTPASMGKQHLRIGYSNSAFFRPARLRATFNGFFNTKGQVTL